MSKTLEALVKTHLAWDNRIIDTDIEVEVKNSIAKLSGTVPTYLEKKLAEEDALSLQGILNVDNKLEVARSKYTLLSDREIKNAIENSLLWNTNIDSRNIEVSVNIGIVTLEGFVDAYWKKLEAEDLAFRTISVVDVINNLQVKELIKVADEVIAKDVKDALDRSIIDAEHIKIKVEDGVVSLDGTVSNNTEKVYAYDKAAFTAGVKEVVNNLSVE